MSLVNFPEVELAALVNQSQFLSDFESTRYSNLNGRMAGYARQAISSFPSDANAYDIVNKYRVICSRLNGDKSSSIRSTIWSILNPELNNRWLNHIWYSIKA